MVDFSYFNGKNPAEIYLFTVFKERKSISKAGRASLFLSNYASKERRLASKALIR